MSIRMISTLGSAAFLALMLAASGFSARAQAVPHHHPHPPQQLFDTPDAAVDAFVAAVKSNDPKSIFAVLGPGSGKLINSGDPVLDQQARQRFLDSYAAKHALVAEDDSTTILEVGPDSWPTPIPLVKTTGGWRFDAPAGAQQILNRRIGRDEIAAIRGCLFYVDAQNDYFDRAKRGRGTGFYAQRLVSTEGHYDGLYWPVAEGEPLSPLGPLVQQAESEGYPSDLVKGRRTSYQGYYYHILTAQGPNADGGAKSYVADGKMIAGFALVAWPARYGASGVQTFIVDQDGIVFQKDLGPDTARAAAAITRYDPDPSWLQVSLSDN